MEGINQLKERSSMARKKDTKENFEDDTRFAHLYVDTEMVEEHTSNLRE